MNKKNNRKGFTIVELVIVIAVIAILATVLVPTFGDVIGNANKTAAVQEVKNAYTAYTVKYATTAGYDDDIVIKYEGKFYSVTGGAVVDENGNLVSAAEPATGVTYYDAAAGETVEMKCTCTVKCTAENKNANCPECSVKIENCDK